MSNKSLDDLFSLVKENFNIDNNKEEFNQIRILFSNANGFMT